MAEVRAWNVTRPRTLGTVQQLETHNMVDLPHALGPFNGPHYFWPLGSERNPTAQESQPQTFITMQQPQAQNIVDLPPPLGPINAPYNFWPSDPSLPHIFGTTAIWRSTPLLFTLLTTVNSDGQPIAPHEEQSSTAAFEAAGAGNDTQAGSQ